jgi:glycosyltransferase involved in cell wall biosynthesis
LPSRHRHFTLRNVRLYSRAEHLQGPVPEIVIHGKKGFVVDTIDEMIEVVRNISLIDPSDWGNHMKENFSIASMAGKYSQLYKSSLDKRTVFNA